MKRLSLLLITLALVACGKPNAIGSTDNWDSGPAAQTQAPAPGKFGAVVPVGGNVYPRAFYNSSPPAPTSGDSVNLQTDSSGNLKISGTISSTPGTTGQATMANSAPVVIASNQSSVPVTEASAASMLTALNLLTQPTTSAAVTPSDSTVLACGKGLFVGTAGNLSLKLSGDSAAVTWKNVPSGVFNIGSVIRVMVATTAADIVCLN